MTSETDILVSGGGIAGMIAALTFAREGLATLCVDPGPAKVEDTRTTAFFQPSQGLLDEIGLWAALAPLATPLQVMTIASLGADGRITVSRSFDAAEISDRPFGWNLPNDAIRTALAGALEAEPKAEARYGTGTRDMLARDRSACVRLTDGARVDARLVVAADGRNSPLRQAAGIGTATHRYGQKALVFTVRHALPHADTSIEIHRSGGPFTLVPLPDAQGHHRSSVVWMERGVNARTLASLPPEAFAAAVNERSGGVLGHLAPEGPPRLWPIISQMADRLTAQRLALVAEAAHVVPPIGAQGLNMSLADIRALRDLASGSDPGADSVLDAYARARAGAIATRFHGIDALNRASIAGAPVLRDLRAEGLKLLHDVAPLRRKLMKAGMG